MRRLRFSHDIGGDWAEHVEPILANVCLPTMQTSERHFIESAVTETWLAPTVRE
jgi:hypothetical protein